MKDYNRAKFHSSSFFGFLVGKKMTPLVLYVLRVEDHFRINTYSGFQIETKLSKDNEKCIHNKHTNISVYPTFYSGSPSFECTIRMHCSFLGLHS